MSTITPIPTDLVLLDRADRTRSIEVLIAGFLAGYRDNTREAYSIDLDLWLRFLREHGQDPLKVERVHIEAWMRHEEARGLKPRTISRRINTVCLLYRYLFDEELLPRDITRKVRRPRIHDEAPADYLDRWDMAEIIRLAEPDPDAYALVCLLGLNGMRISEVLSLRCQDVGWSEGFEVVTFIGKGHKPAVLPLAPETARAVRALVDTRKTGPLLLNKWGRPMRRANAQKCIQTLVRKARIPKHITPHSLRRSFVTNALDAGVPLRDVQLSARHESPSTTMRYDRNRQLLARNATHVVAQTVAAARRAA